MALSKLNTHYEIVVIGAGPGGVCAGVRLKDAGIEDFVILERDSGVGGSWRDNHYPGVGVDFPCVLYQYSFARSSSWSRLFPEGEEVLAYHQNVVRKHGLEPHIRYNTKVIQQVWDEHASHWKLYTANGELITAQFVVSAVGAFLDPKKDPGIDGWRSFQGKVLRPTDWDHGYDATDKRVAIIGTGASSVQIAPVIAKVAAHLDVYQRTPVWCFPKLDFAFGSGTRRFLASPGVQFLINGLAFVVIDIILRIILYTPKSAFVVLARLLDAIALFGYRGYLWTLVDDPVSRAALLPCHGPFCKRPTISSQFLQAFNRRNVSLIASHIERITTTGIRTADGVNRDIDAIIFATGYHVFSDPESYAVGSILGRNGFDLGKFYNAKGLQAYESVSIPGLPNRWMVIGPYSWTGTSWHAMVEISTMHIVNVIIESRRRGAQVVEVSESAHRAYHEKTRELGSNMVSYFNEVNKGVRSYYRNSQGDVPYVRPTTVLSALRSCRIVRFQDYLFTATKGGDVESELTPATRS